MVCTYEGHDFTPGKLRSGRMFRSPTVRQPDRRGIYREEDRGFVLDEDVPNEEIERLPLQNEPDDPNSLERHISDILKCWKTGAELYERRIQSSGVDFKIWKAAGLFLAISIGFYMITSILACVFDLVSLYGETPIPRTWIVRQNFWFSIDSLVEKFVFVPLCLVILLIVSPAPSYPSDQITSFIFSTIYVIVYFYYTGESHVLYSFTWSTIPWYYVMLLGVCFFSIKMLLTVDYDKPVYYALSRISVILLVMYLEGYLYFLYVFGFLGLFGEIWQIINAIRKCRANLNRETSINRRN